MGALLGLWACTQQQADRAAAVLGQAQTVCFAADQARSALVAVASAHELLERAAAASVPPSAPPSASSAGR